MKSLSHLTKVNFLVVRFGRSEGMREILFKGKRKDNGEWIEGSLIVFPDGDCFICCADTASKRIDMLYKKEVDPETVCQYTGLKDKNGRKIWEGDIFKFNDEAWESCYTSCGIEYDSWDIENYAVVGFDKYAARYDFVNYKYCESSIEADLHENHDIEFADFVGELEVIGNIFDNPELLEV